MATAISTGIEHDPSMLAELAALDTRPKDQPDRSFLDQLKALSAQPATYKLDEAQIAKLAAAGITIDEIAEAYAAPVTSKPKSEPETRAINDRVNAIRLVEKYSDVAKYITQKKTWVYWDRPAGVWRYDLLERATNMGKDIVQGLYQEVASASISSDEKGKLMKDVWKHQTGPHIRECVRLAQSDPKIAVEPSLFDQDHYRLNCLNGSLDLLTGEFISHEGNATRDLFLMKQCPVIYDPAARSTEWEKFLNDSLQGDKDLIYYVQKAAGYSLCGSCEDEVFFFIHGDGGTGKSTFISAIQSVLGSYQRSANFETFLASRREGSGASEDIARMVGVRMIAAIETNEKRRMDIGTVKKLSGRDKLTARSLYEKSFEFNMTSKLWLVANSAPRIPDGEDAIWRRLIEIPFVVKPAKVDKKLKDRLQDVSLNGSAILNWMIEGFKAWQRDGALTGEVPQKILEATRKYKDSMNPLAEFVDEYGEREPANTPTAERYSCERDQVYSCYTSFFDENKEKSNDKPLSKRAVTTKLEALGFEAAEVWNPDKKEMVNIWYGLRLKDKAAEVAKRVEKAKRAAKQQAADDKRPLFASNNPPAHTDKDVPPEYRPKQQAPRPPAVPQPEPEPPTEDDGLTDFTF